MPRPVNLNSRATKDIHAEWWSDKRDESGRYVERCVIYADYLQADAQGIQARIVGALQLDQNALMRAVQANDPSALEIDLGGAEKSDMYNVQALCVEMTDEDGVRQPIEDEATFLGLPERDAKFIIGELNAISKPLVKPTPQDAEIAASARKPKSAQAVAEDSFRGRSQAAASGR